VSTLDSTQVETVAVIGMAGRFPGAADVTRFWDLLRDGVEGLTRFTEDELVAAGVPLETARHPAYVPVKGLMAEADWFDAGFFGYTPREAELMDPQHRVMLECGWHALEHAGYDPDRYEGSVGVYAGVGANTYLLSQLMGVVTMDPAAAYQVFIGNDKDFLSTRLSYKAGLRGPSMVVQTACSTSLVAIHLAAQALLAHQCDLALAGGVAANFPAARGYAYQEGMILSPDGRCRTFDHRAAGTVPGEGVAVVALKRLTDALADGDNILAVIKGTAINNDGGGKAGYTAPSVDGQAEVIATAQAVADVEPDTITYVEAHGTATPLGDPIEFAALTKAFRMGTDRRNYCAIGSVKSNIGHLDTAAGVAGVVKTVLALQHRQIPPSLHFERPNPALEIESSPFYVNTTLRDWPAGPGPLRAAVSSFGIGGTNAHAILEEAPPVEPGDAPARRAEVLVLSGRSDQAAAAAARNLAAHLRAHPELPLADAAHVLQVGRKRFEYRRALVCQSVTDAIAGLEAAVDARFEERRDRKAIFMFPGQGSQRPGMARVLYEREPVFRSAFDACLDGLEGSLAAELRTLLCESEPDSEAAADRLARTELTQPALFVFEYALARLWMSWGVQPEAMIGHSSGEYVAACLAGVFSLADGLALVAKRGQLMQGMRPGAMLAVPLPSSEIGDLLAGGLELAAVNAPALCALGGSVEDVARAQRQLEARGVPARTLPTSHAFHSSHMQPVLDTFTDYVAQGDRRAPSIPFISCVTGTWITAGQATDPRYWASQLRQPVRFADGLRELGPDRVFLEVGPGRALATLARQAGQPYHDVMTSLERPGGDDDDVRILGALGDLWRAGVEVDWTGFRNGERRRRIALPMYAFERQRYFAEASPDLVPARSAISPRNTRLEQSQWFYAPTWRRGTSPAPAAGSSMPGHWLVFEDDGGTATGVAAHLAASGARVTRARPGVAFRQESPGLFTVDPRSVEDVERLIEAAREYGSIDAVAHFSGLNTFAGATDPTIRDAVFYLPLYLARGVLSRSHAPCRFAMISSGVQSVLGDECLHPAKAALLGACRVIPQEYPQCATLAVDVTPDMATDATVVARLAAELLAADWHPITALRGRHRWVQEFEPCQLDVPDGGDVLKEGGVYLITGGAGGMGVALAEHLVARQLRPKLAIVGRTVLVGAEPGVDESGGRAGRVARLQALEAAGAEVLFLTADVGRTEDAMRAVAETRARFGRIDGVFHLAGQVSGTLIPEIDRATAERQFKPKLDGVRALTAALGEADLDFAIVASSIASVLGGLGFATYAAANASIDAFALAERDSSAVPWRTVNWDAWDFDEVRGAVPGPGAELRRLAIRPDEGAEAWVRVLSDSRFRQVLVSTSDLNRRLAAWVDRAAPQVSPGAARAVAHPRPALSTAFVEPRNEVDASIARIWQDLLGVDRVGIADNFFELGGHSLLAVQIAGRIREQYTIDLPLRRIFEAVTIAELSDEISALQWATNRALVMEPADDREEFRL
jgi:acyl transferase domain-containing protein